MISSKILSDGDKKKSSQLSKRIKTDLVEEFFFQPHHFSDLILIVQDKELYVDKSILSASSKVFQSYFQDDNINSIEILDVSSNEMIELLQFLYPQFQCTIHNENVTILLILSHRFELNFLSSACRTFILYYLSKLEYINNNELIQQEDGTRLSILSLLDTLCIWYREFSFIDDRIASEEILNKLSKCTVSNILASNGFKDIEEKNKWKILQARAKYLENRRI